MGQRSSTEQPTTIGHMGHSSDRGPTVTSRKRYSTGPDQTNSSDYRKIGYRTDNVPDKTGHRRSLVSRDRSKSTDRPSRLDGQGFRIPLRNSSPNNRSPSFSSPSRRSRRKHRSEKKKKRIRHSSSSDSSISSSSSSSRSRSRRHKKRHHRSRSVSRHHRHRHGRKRRRSPSSSSERRSKKSFNVRADAKSVSPVRQSLSPSPSRSTVAHEISLTVGPHDDDFQSPSKSKSQETTNIADSQFLSNVEPPEFQDEEEKFSFAQVIDEIFNILPEEKFPRKEAGTDDNPRPKSSIESEMVKEKRKSISLPQSALIVDSINFIQNQLKLNNKSFTENWLPTNKDISALANLKYYQAHAEKFMTSSATPLDNDASKLNLSLNGNYQIPIKSLDMYEKQLRETLRMLSHTDVFSFAAFKCLQQESLKPKCSVRF